MIMDSSEESSDDPPSFLRRGVLSPAEREDRTMILTTAWRRQNDVRQNHFLTTLVGAGHG